MKPILYPANATTFNNRGLGALADAVSCVVVEERNGEYELELEYPVDGVGYENIGDRCIITAIPSPYRTPQPFRIYQIEKPLNGIVTIRARHLSYDLSGIPVSPFIAGSCTQALNGLVTNSVVANLFTTWTDKSVTSTYKLSVPTSFRACLGGQEGSILDVYGKGEYEFDKYAVKLHLNRGSDNGVKIAYGKNLIDFNMERNLETVVTGILPYWANVDEDEVIEGDIITIYDINNPAYLLESGGAYLLDSAGRYLLVQNPFPFNNVLPLDLSSEFETAPTKAQLKERTEKYIRDNGLGVPRVSIDVSFVQLEQTEEYKDLAVLEQCDLCDTVTVEFPLYGISAKAEIIRIETDVLLEKYNSVQIGDARTSLADTLAHLEVNSVTKSEAKAGNQKAADVINNTKGVFEWIDNGDGTNGGFTIYEADDSSSWLRCTAGGLGISDDGGITYANAITPNGIVATQIKSGEMSADRIRGGTLTLGGNNNTDGLMEVYDANTVLRTIVDKDGITSRKNEQVAGQYIWFTTHLSSSELNSYQENNPIYRMGPAYSSFGDNTACGSLGCYRPFYIFAGAGGGVSLRYTGLDPIGNYHAPWYLSGNVYLSSGLTVAGTKSRASQTKDYGQRLLYALETPSPLFADVGEGEIAEDGYAYIIIDPTFAQTIQSDAYHVVITEYSEDDVRVIEKTSAYFICKGTPYSKFTWMLLAKQKGYEVQRLDEIDNGNFTVPQEEF